MAPGATHLVGVSGGGDASAREISLAEEFGAAVAAAGAVVVCGGLGGVMEACARGAVQAGGTTIGILPGDHAGAANRWITYPIVTGMGQARNVILVHTSRVLVAIGGAYGTLSEVALALKIGVPVGLLASWMPQREGVAAPCLARFTTAAEAAAWALAGARDAERHAGGGAAASPAGAP